MPPRTERPRGDHDTPCSVRGSRGGDHASHRWLEAYGIQPELRVASQQTEAFAQPVITSGRERQELLDQAVDDLIELISPPGFSI